MPVKQLSTAVAFAALALVVGIARGERPSPPTSIAAVPGIEVGINHNNKYGRQLEFPEFIFRAAGPGRWPVPPISDHDLASGIEPVLISGTPHALSGPLAKLTDGLGQVDRDDPPNSFFAKNAPETARIRISLPRAQAIGEIHLYSWHHYALTGGTRAPQKIDVYAAPEAADEKNFAIDDPHGPGYVRLASIDTRREGDADAQSGQHGSSVHRADGSPLGMYRHFIFDLHTPVNDADHTFLGEIDIVAPPPAPQSTPNTAAARHFDDHVAPLLAARCLECHNGSELKGGLDLTRLDTSLAGGESGPAFAAGDVESNLLARVEADDMPPKHPLSADEKKILRDWITSGAEWGTSPIDRFRFSSSARAGFDWWSLKPIVKPKPPRTDNAWGVGPIDDFVLAKLEEKKLSPSPAADRRTLLRRLTFDLHGLPPTAEQIEAFENDRDPNAYEKLVDGLLASPHYGERWARHWLDVVRFAESQGFERNKFYPNAWRFRDWVISAMNADLPYDEFVRLQLAGDVLKPDDPAALIAASYLCIGPQDMLGLTQGSLAMKENTREDELENVVGNVGQTFMALTVNCARCHDHKFDPIYQREFFQLASAFGGLKRTLRSSPKRDYTVNRELRLSMGTVDAKLRESLGPDGEELLDQARAEAIASAEANVPALEKAVADAQAKRDKNKDDLNALAVLEDRQRDLEAAEDASIAAKQPYSTVAWDKLADKLTSEQRAAAEPWIVELSRLEQTVGLRWGGSIQTIESGPTQFFYLQKRGSFRSLGEVVAPAALACVHDASFGEPLSPGAPESERRLRMAEWITHPQHPLTARVIVNRLWHYHFGVGLVDTPNDFGFSGGRPSHGELLDYLASSLMEEGWSLKRLHREILLSATYRQSAAANPDAMAVDADNRLLWRKTPLRLDAETLRDSVLAVSGRLNPRLGGPSFRDVQPSVLADNVDYKPTDAFDATVNRRSVYRTVARAATPPLLDSFDCADPTIATPRRAVTTTPLQALSLLNSKFMTTAAGEFAARVTAAAGDDVERQVGAVYQTALGREPTEDEANAAAEFVREFTLPEFCLLIFNCNEFLYID